MKKTEKFKEATVSRILGWGFIVVSIALAYSLLSLPAKAADSYTGNLRIVQQVPGSNDSTWGTKANAAFAMLDEAISKVTSVSVTAGDVVLTTANNATDQARSAVLIFTGTPGVTRNVTAPNVQKTFYLYNNSDSIVVFKAGAGTTVTVPAGAKSISYSDGATNAASLLITPVGALVGTTDAQTLTTKTISGASNTLTNIGNASLTNSSITIGGAVTPLGGTVTASTILDSIGNTQGNVAYRGASGWVVLAPGANGQVLTSGGGSANLSWTTPAGGGGAALLIANNLSDLNNFATARSNLGVTATGSDTTYAYRANNLSDLANFATSRSNLGVTATGADTTYAFRSNNLSDVTASTARTNLGLGTQALHNYSIATVAAGCHTGGASGDVCYEY